MPTIKRGSKKEVVAEEIQKHVVAVNQIIKKFQVDADINTFETSYNSWRNNTNRTLKDVFSDSSMSDEFSLDTVNFTNKFSKQNTINSLNEGVRKGIDFLQILKYELLKGIYDEKQIQESNKVDKHTVIDKAIALIIIRKILNNFYKHIQAMYQDKVHGNGNIKQEDLNRIQIGNEYDVQRILYSLIRPIFPEVRLEVAADAGYNAVRYDVVLDEYGIVIEVKCSRKSMSERKLTEELGADVFHYKAEFLFLFIYDKENIIKNADAFIKGHKREKDNFDKDVEAIIIQPLTL